ncbi:hypothetical protein [Agarivorans aestuarii]|uniref:hypothetical protein n=1 Tax=Agarivorans aestuarii TaxID=1563703 RepID=UPI001C7F4455|nr:hypothetical protein [Agarivorans aestuarii]
MLYRLNLLTAGLIMTFSGAASSTSLLMSNENLANELELKYQALNAKTQVCREARRNHIEVEKITSNWFLALPAESKKVVLLVASHEAMERCTKAQADEYSLILVEYAAQTEDKNQLDEWLKIKQNFKPDELVNDINELNSEELIAFLKEPLLSEPFDLIAIIKQLNL